MEADANGIARFEHVQPGTYTLLVRTTHGLPASHEEWEANTDMSAVVVEVGEEGLQVGIDLR